MSQLLERQHFTAKMSPFWRFWHPCNESSAYVAIASCAPSPSQGAIKLRRISNIGTGSLVHTSTSYNKNIIYQNEDRYSKLTKPKPRNDYVHFPAGARPRPGHHGAVHQDSQDEVLHHGVTHWAEGVFGDDCEEESFTTWTNVSTLNQHLERHIYTWNMIILLYNRDCVVYISE